MGAMCGDRHLSIVRSFDGHTAATIMPHTISEYAREKV